MIVELEHGPRRGPEVVEDLKTELWLRCLGGKSPNIRVMEALYTYSRAENGKTIFRYRRSREIQSPQATVTNIEDHLQARQALKDRELLSG